MELHDSVAHFPAVPQQDNDDQKFYKLALDCMVGIISKPHSFEPPVEHMTNRDGHHETKLSEIQEKNIMFILQLCIKAGTNFVSFLLTKYPTEVPIPRLHSTEEFATCDDDQCTEQFHPKCVKTHRLLQISLSGLSKSNRSQITFLKQESDLQRLFIKAIGADNAEMIQTLLTFSEMPDPRQVFFRSHHLNRNLLQIAVIKQVSDAVITLILQCQHSDDCRKMLVKEMDYENKTSLHHAAQQKSGRLLRKLMPYTKEDPGVALLTETRAQVTVFQYACVYLDDEECLDMLQSYQLENQSMFRLLEQRNTIRRETTATHCLIIHKKLKTLTFVLNTLNPTQKFVLMLMKNDEPRDCISIVKEMVESHQLHKDMLNKCWNELLLDSVHTKLPTLGSCLLDSSRIFTFLTIGGRPKLEKAFSNDTQYRPIK